MTAKEPPIDYGPDENGLFHEYQHKQRFERVLWVKKNLIDSTAGLSYCLGVSIIHLSMFMALFSVEKPDLSKVTGFNRFCQKEANDWDFLIKFCNSTHIIMFVGNSYREIWGARTDMFG